MRLSPLILGILLSVSLTGCTTPSKLPDQDAAYFTQKAESALSRKNCIKKLSSMSISGLKGKHVSISINADPQTAEADCLKVMRALALEPLPPADYGEFGFSVACNSGTRNVDTTPPMLMATPDGRLVIVTPPPFLQSTRTKKVITMVFVCVIKRDALLRGEDPEVITRNFIRVSGLLKGQRDEYLED